MCGVEQVTFCCCFSKWKNLFKIHNSPQSADNNASSVTLVISETQAGTTEMSERVARVPDCKTCDTRSTKGVLCSFTFWVCLLIITPLWVRTYLPSPRTWCCHNLFDCRIMQKLPWQSSWKSAERCSMDTGKIHRIIHSIEVEKVFSNDVWKTRAPFATLYWRPHRPRNWSLKSWQLKIFATSNNHQTAVIQIFICSVWHEGINI